MSLSGYGQLAGLEKADYDNSDYTKPQIQFSNQRLPALHLFCVPEILFLFISTIYAFSFDLFLIFVKQFYVANQSFFKNGIWIFYW